jgi:hypothetical protein
MGSLEISLVTSQLIPVEAFHEHLTISLSKKFLMMQRNVVVSISTVFQGHARR